MARILSRVAIGMVAAGAMVASQLNTSDSTNWDIGDAQLAAARLEVARDCDDVTRRMQEITTAQMAGRDEGTYDAAMGLDGNVRDFAGREGVVGLSAEAASAAPAAGERAADTASGSASIVGTNIQELGVDETDVLKTDGETIFVLRDERLIAIDASTLEELDRIEFNDRFPYEMLLSGDRLVLFENSYEEMRRSGSDTDDVRMGMPYSGGNPVLRLTIVDVTDPSAIRTDSVVKVDGSLVAARLVDGFVRVVVSTAPSYWYGGFGGREGIAIDMVAPGTPSSTTAEPITLTAEDVLPTITIDKDGGSTSAPVPCDGVHIAPDAQTIESTTVFSLDPMNPEPVGSVTAMTGGGTVYANTRSIYIARPIWDNRGERSELHRFDITDPKQTRYVSSGTIKGSLLNQFSMSEHEGVVRVATTDNGSESNGYVSESAVRILDESGDRLVEVGTVAGLGVTERIFAVRFLGTAAYVVTFRQVDPLYVLDLSDPTNPRAVGELKIPGYSAYLHPLGDNLLVGVGQDATKDGRTTGVLVSLFDVSDPSDPRRIAKLSDLGQWSAIEGDHRAFQHLPDRGLIVVPTSTWNEVGFAEPAPDRAAIEERKVGETGGQGVSAGIAYQPQLDSSAQVIHVSENGLEIVGRVSHASLLPDPSNNEKYRTGEITRSIAIDDTLFTLSDAGITATNLGSLDVFDSISW